MLTLLIYSALLTATAPPAGHSALRRAEVYNLASAIVDHHGQEDPWTLAALAVKETRANTQIVGKLGECGAMQVMGWHLRPARSCKWLQTTDGSVKGAVIAMAQWREWAPADVDPWGCYAAGTGCIHGHGQEATARLFAIRAQMISGTRGAGLYR